MNYGFSSTSGFCVKNDAVHGFGFLDSYDSVCKGPLLNLGEEWSRLLVFIREGLGELDNKKKSLFVALSAKLQWLLVDGNCSDNVNVKLTRMVSGRPCLVGGVFFHRRCWTLLRTAEMNGATGLEPTLKGTNYGFSSTWGFCVKNDAGCVRFWFSESERWVRYSSRAKSGAICWFGKEDQQEEGKKVCL